MRAVVYGSLRNRRRAEERKWVTLDRSSSGFKGNCLLFIVRRFFEEDTLLRMRFVIRTTDTTC